MASISGMLGLAGGANGTGFGGPQSAGISNPTDATQIQNAYTGAQGSLQQQQNLLAALQAQNGLGNQSAVYNQLQGVANGIGPNPALAQLNQATGANTANQAALMASQRGANSNAGLIARQAAMQGAANQQNAAGQAATLQANQSLNALGQMGGLANTQAANQIGQVNANTQAQQNEQGQLIGAQGAYNNASVGSQSSVNNANAHLAGVGMQQQGDALGGVMKGAGTALALLAQGGAVHKMADGGNVQQDQSAFQGPSSRFGSFLSNRSDMNAPAVQNSIEGMPTPNKNITDAVSGGLNSLANYAASRSPDIQAMGGGSQGSFAAPNMNQPMMAAGGKVPALLSPGERYLEPKQAQKVAEGKSNPMKDGKKVPGKAKVGGAKNDYSNDTVPATLEEGGIVIPREVTQGKDAEKRAIAFVRAHMTMSSLKKGK